MLLLFVDCCIVIFLLYPLLTPLLARHCYLSPNHRAIKSLSTTLSHDASHPPWAYIVSRPSVTMAFSPSLSPVPAMARHPSSPPLPPPPQSSSSDVRSGLDFKTCYSRIDLVQAHITTWLSQCMKRHGPMKPAINVQKHLRLLSGGSHPFGLFPLY